MKSFSDKQLIEKCLKGHDIYCRAIFDRYKQYVATIISGFFENEADIEELVQDAFLRIFKGLSRFRHEANLKTWITTVTINVCRDRKKSKKHKVWENRLSIDSSSDNDEDERPMEIKAPGSYDPAAAADSVEQRVLIRRAMQELSEEHREAILLWNEGFKYSEMAKIIGVPEKTAGTRVYYAKKRLKEILSRYFSGEKS